MARALARHCRRSQRLLVSSEPRRCMFGVRLRRREQGDAARCGNSADAARSGPGCSGRCTGVGIGGPAPSFDSGRFRCWTGVCISGCWTSISCRLTRRSPASLISTDGLRFRPVHDGTLALLGGGEPSALAFRGGVQCMPWNPARMPVSFDERTGADSIFFQTDFYFFLNDTSSFLSTTPVLFC
eukprot:TRINITY_DN319_c1_g1_i1.p2 TRINITY_DN319_c1_g1~~TRINITY_DN319_c1_g1_i1.p2  ORF type:complete len:184 (-),score=11.88 TRINITY_DN319_c1_g1_i1:212-763(-)